MTDDEADRILAALSVEGFVLPYAARSRDYLDPDMEGEERREAIRRLQEADREAERQNRDALRRALEGVEQS